MGIADEIGKRISDKSNAEIEKIAYKSWFELQPTKSITKYDSQTKQSVGFQKLTADEWVNTINKAVNENRQGNDIAPIEAKYSQQESKVNLPVRKLTYDESVKKYNIDSNNETVKSIKRVLEERGIQGRFDDTIFTDNTQDAVWIPTKNNDGTITREVVFNPNTVTEKTLQNISVHEMAHDFEGSDTYSKIRDVILKNASMKEEYTNARKSLEETYARVYDKDSMDFQKLVDDEAVASILGNKLGDQDFINSLVRQDRTIMQKIYDWIVDKLNKLTGYSNEKIFWEDVKRKFETAYNEEYKGNNEKKLYSILMNSKNQKYVKADRKVIKGNNPREWQKQTQEYINQKIRNGQNVNVITENGDILTITKDTAGKAKFRNTVLRADGKRTTMSNEELLTKLTAETHIDELAQISTKTNQNPIPDTKNHKFAKDGFDYRRAYFEDFDGQYYKITMSVGKNGSLDTIYNIGILDNLSKKNRSKSSVTAQRPLSLMTNEEDLSSTSSITPTKADVNPKYSMQELENNSGSFNLQSRLNGDELLNAQDLIEEIQSVGAKVDENGYVTVYHRTTKENAEQIRKTGKMSAKEDGIFFSTSKEGYNNANYGESIVELKVPAEKLVLDDIFADEASVKIPLKDKNEILDVSDYLTVQNNKRKINQLTEDGIVMTYTRNPNTNTKHYGVTYGQNIEPAGEYMNMDTLQGKTKLPGMEYGTIEFKKPLVLEWKNTNNTGWKKDLSVKYGGLTGKKLSDAIKKAGYDAIMTVDENGNYMEIVNLNGKKLDTKPATDPNIRYSKETGKWQNFLDKNYPNSGKGETMQDIKLPIDTSKVKQPSSKTKLDSTTSYNLPINENTKQRKHYKSIIESSNMTPEAKKTAKKLLNADSYVPESNKKQLANADNRIETAIQLSGKKGIDAETTSLLSRAMNGEKITANDIALGERLIQYYSKTGDKAKLQEAIQATAMAGTTAGQTVQALSLLNHQTPEGQAIWLQRSVDKMNKELTKKRGQKAEQFNLTNDMLQKITNSKNSEELHNNLNEVYAELGQQVSKTTAQKIDAWRYFSMLANPRTHIRNIVGNTAMAGVQGILYHIKT